MLFARKKFAAACWVCAVLTLCALGSGCSGDEGAQYENCADIGEYNISRDGGLPQTTLDAIALAAANKCLTNVGGSPN